MPSVCVGDMLGNGVKFDGDNDFVSIPHFAGVDFTNASDFSISITFVTYALGTLNFLVHKLAETGSQSGYFLRLESNGKIGLWTKRIEDTTYNRIVTTNVEIIPNRIYHLVAGISGTTVANWKLWLNNKEPVVTRTGTFTTGTIENTHPLKFGRWNDGSTNAAFNGVIHNISIYNKILNSDEVLFLYKSDGSKIPSTAIANLIDKWDFEHKSDTTLNGLKGNNGTLINFASTDLGSENAWVDNNQQPITS